MPRIVTIVSPEVPHISLFTAAALARTPDFTVYRTPDESLVRYIDGQDRQVAALDVPHPFTVTDQREVERVVGVLPPTTWQPVVLTRCMLPIWHASDMWAQVVADAAGMSNGYAVERGEIVRTVQPWPWSRDEEGAWRPDPAWHDAQVDAYYARTGQERPDKDAAGLGDGSSAPTTQ
ncbi:MULTISPECIES: hypothetical protein [Actinomyces]|uniref:Uncharacterized protein n=1 Tax=Actinomyces respiraculi TaxID=2744574 RepID=A0A7T0LL50_9ACTO|nr:MULTISPECIES: hypothetical protein [Actinomyces]QPL05353.1 hypothetical protein ID810_11710 [Actinomyces respiraculi]